MKSFTDGIVAWNKKRYGVDIDPEPLVITTGVHPGLIAALQDVLAARAARCCCRRRPTTASTATSPPPAPIAEENPLKVVNGRYSIDFEDFERRISHDTNTFILCNPQNPTGNCWSPEDLTAPRRNLPAAPRRRARRRDPLRLRHQGQQVHAVREPAEQGDRQQQHHVQGGEQVVRPRGDEVRVVLLRQRGLHRPGQGEQPRRPDDARHDRQQGGVRGRRGLAQRSASTTSTATTTSSRSSSTPTSR